MMLWFINILLAFHFLLYFGFWLCICHWFFCVLFWYLGRGSHCRLSLHLLILNFRSLFKRSFSDGNILGQSGLPMSTTNDKQEKFTNSTLPDQSQGGSHGLSESSPEISTCESDISYSRFLAFHSHCWISFSTLKCHLFLIDAIHSP